jgi:hypothetical protein
MRMLISNSEFPSLPNEVWVDILRHLSLDTLWHSTRPVCSLFYHVSTSIVKSALVDGSSCELRHYISFKDPLLPESLYYPLVQTEYHQRILEQEGNSPFSQILLWSSPFMSPVNPQNGPGIPTLNYESVDGKKCVTMAVFGQQDRTLTTSSSSTRSAFHCRRTGCMIDEKESASDGRVCLAGCWHIHHSRVDRKFCATIPLSILLRIYLRLELARREKTTDRGYILERKGRWNPGSRHGVSASVSPLTEFGDMLENMLGVQHNNGPATLMEEEEGQGTLMELSEDEDVFLNGFFDAGLEWDAIME